VNIRMSSSVSLIDCSFTTSNPESETGGRLLQQFCSWCRFCYSGSAETFSDSTLNSRIKNKIWILKLQTKNLIQ
jgi:hypothetical protein